jgi:phenylpropionate dioxygenase-like ring-hydroxylating dioxygenase large terminal subunit
MIPKQWYVVMDSAQIRDKPVGVTRMGEKLVFWRNSRGNVACLRDKCPHRGVKLSLGKVLGGHLQCPFHGFEFDTAGRVTVIPANGKNKPVPKRLLAHSYPTYEAHGFVWIWWDEEPADELQPPRFFDDIDDSFSYSTAYDPWMAHYSRVIENQLDVVHVPFVHSNSIGRGGRTVVDGPAVQWIDDDAFFIYVHNRLDDGTPALRPSQVPIPDAPDRSLKLEFLFPNLWQNWIQENMRVVAAFAPVDDEHTLLYLRFYQKFLRLPLLSDLANWIAMRFNLYVAHQDRRIVETHQPQRSSLKIGEALIQGDRPVAEYRRRREQLLDAAAT